VNVKLYINIHGATIKRIIYNLPQSTFFYKISCYHSTAFVPFSWQDEAKHLGHWRCTCQLYQLWRRGSNGKHFPYHDIQLYLENALSNIGA